MPNRAREISGLLGDVINRGTVGGLLGAPVDLVNLGLLGIGGEAPVGGSEWWGQQMERAGLVSDQRRPWAELAAGLATPAGVVGAIGALPKISRLSQAADGKMLASKSASIYDPKPLPQRPFEHDYPNAGTSPGDAGRRLEVDIDGRPIAARYVAGRRVVGDGDTGLSHLDIDRARSALDITRVPAPRTGPDLKGDSGRYVRSGGDRSIYIDRKLDAPAGDQVHAHEVGHAIEDLVLGREIPTKGLDKELRRIYEDLNSGAWFKPGRGARPEGAGYQGGDVQRELMAEAIRAYLRDPNYIKTVAPKTAARIREYVNTNPNLNRVVHFNALGGIGAGGLLSERQEPVPPGLLGTP